MRIRTFFIGVVLLAVGATAATRVTAQDNKAIEVLAAARKAIGGKKLESLKTLSIDASLQRNVNSMQLASEVEILLDLPDKYVRSDTSSGGMMAGSMATGFRGDTPIKPANATFMPGGGMMIRMGPGGALPTSEKLSPEEQERVDKQLLRSSRADISRLMLGWFATAHPSLDVQYSYAGEAESPDGKAYVIDAKNADGFTARLFIDQATKLPLMVTYQAPAPRVVTAGGPRPAGAAPQGAQREVRREMTEEERKKAREEAEKHLQETLRQPPPMENFSLYFDDWREVDGVRFPHKVRRAMSGTTNEEWTINKVRVNPKIDPKKFEG
jgi:hypothetical protein